MYLQRTEAPTGQILTLDEVKAQLRIDFTDEDILLADLVATVTEQLEGYNGRSGYLGRALLTQTFEFRTDHFPECGAALSLPMPPLKSVTSVKYLDQTGVLQTLDPASYIVETALLQGRIRLPRRTFWPVTACEENAVRITFVAGYGTAADIPLAIKHAAKMLVGMLYNTREGGIDTKGGFGFALDALLEQHRQHGF